MNSIERKEYILGMLDSEHSVRINELSQELKVTRETIRRDLYTLEDEGRIKKVHGGAILEISTGETDYKKRKIEKWKEKEQIAKKAVSYIEEGDSIYLDYGTTTLALAKEIAKLKNITVVTNTLPIINVLVKNQEINLIIPGGVLRNNESSLFGQFALNNICDIFVTIGFFGCSGIDSKAAITSHHMGEVLISKQMIQQSQTSIVIADQSKFGSIALNRTANFDDIDIVVTDYLPDGRYELDYLGDHGVELIVSN
ncbi:DeoR/GlpR transcriptional regulator [Enterococcus hulanensis]|uniref:DeoR/GlpR family DNA-binding transcription regulator n=1 Tax=Enterococcus hulanensis TaxID=2559929 RepID=UPI001A8D1918|nr:DeoR/GlpR family DNA-binding transcription regulator [Enterococcus hulanensis]MBO0457123.1 DeoR/GlpR transcriptional regulator [Enterococcus hulanensis]